MIPPTSIDGTDITGATIDGTEVTEITVDGDTVFTAGPSNLPVAFSNLIAWYPFDSATYGGSNADDVTAIVGGSGDDTAHDGNVISGTYQSSGGVTDINAGPNSGAFDFNGSSGGIDTNFDIGTTNELTIMCWFETSSTSLQAIFGQIFFSAPNNATEYGLEIIGGELAFDMRHPSVQATTSFQTNTYIHACGRFDNGSMTLFVDGSVADTASYNSSITPTIELKIGDRSTSGFALDGRVDDARLYDVALTNAQIQQIYDNTKP